MVVRMLATAAGPAGVFTAGEVVEIDEALGAAFVAAGAAVRLDAPLTGYETPEDALLPVEQAVLNKRRRIKSDAA